MIKALRRLFKQPIQKKKEDGLSEEMKEQLAQSVESFKQREIYKILTADIIDTTPDGSLLQIVFDHLSANLPPDHQQEYETVMSWNTSRQAIYMIWALEAEVNNGGYNQFYFNSSGQFYKHLPDALQLIGANRFTALTRRANDTFEKENWKITRHQDGSLEGFSKSYEDNPLNGYDDAFYGLYKEENLQQLQIIYIRDHQAEFVSAFHIH